MTLTFDAQSPRVGHQRRGFAHDIRLVLNLAGDDERGYVELAQGIPIIPIPIGRCLGPSIGL